MFWGSVEVKQTIYSYKQQNICQWNEVGSGNAEGGKNEVEKVQGSGKKKKVRG